jgi:peroxiredoxin
VELQSRAKELREQGLGLAAISYDPPEVLDAFSRQHGITFPLLSDSGSATIKRYGILNPVPEIALGPNASDPGVNAEVQKYVSVVNPNARMIGIAFPGTFMLDKDGRVTSRFFEDFYIERNTVSSLMLKLGVGTAPVNATKISTAHLEATTYPSDAAIAPGNRITLTLDIVPRSGMHVYAPGASGYRVIALDIEPQPFVRALPTTYPASEIYFFAPLKERVPVFQKPFKLLRDVVIEGTPQAQAALKGKETITIAGRLEYQACDDKVCFNPSSLPLTWTMSLRPLVRERPPVRQQ